jgi:hypothetical protein
MGRWRARRTTFGDVTSVAQRARNLPGRVPARSSLREASLCVSVVRMNEELWITAVRTAGVFHFVTLVLASFTPIPPNWDENLSLLPEVHRRFSVAQNVFIGATIAFCGAVSVWLAPELVSGSTMARVVCAGIALWWGARLVVLQWLQVWPHLVGLKWKIGFVLLHLECAAYAVAYGWLALRR